MAGIGKILVLALILFTGGLKAQQRWGKVVYERRTNLEKKLQGNRWYKSDVKVRVDTFELFFNDSVSVFRPLENDLKDNMQWATEKNTVYQNLKTGKRYNIKSVWGEKVHYTDTLYIRKWKITDNFRKIAGYNCRKAMWEVNDSTRLYAWYTDEILPSTGPESFNGLPGLILGLAVEDGAVIYFARSVSFNKPDVSFDPPADAKKVYTAAELRKKMEQDFKQPWGKEIIKNFFGIW